MEKKSNNIAVLETDTHKSITYQELKIKVENLMCILIEFGVHKGDKVGIYLPKGSNQIVAVLAILGMGESAEDLHINAVVAPVKKKELTSIHITNAEKENLEKLEKYYEEEIDQDLFERWINKSEEVVTSDIFNTWKTMKMYMFS